MLSDRRVIEQPLAKIECTVCGLVRSAERPSVDFDSYYEKSYSSGIHDHLFYVSNGTLRRSEVFAEWILEAFTAERFTSARRCLEIGAGGGYLLAALQERLPNAEFEGIEIGTRASESAKSRGLRVHNAALEDWDDQPYDVVYSIAVIEHLLSPLQCFRKCRDLLRPEGWLILSQPTQDVPSYDILFADHLYHFGSAHLRAFAQRTGFREIVGIVGHPLMPNFSLHVFQTASIPNDFQWQGPPSTTACRATVQRLREDFSRLDDTLRDLSSGSARVATFGLQEAFWVARTYSSLFDFPLVCGLEDQPRMAEYADIGFPVCTPDAAHEYDVSDALLAMNKVYYDRAEARLSELGIRAHRIFS